jgi:hypothetical protein
MDYRFVEVTRSYLQEIAGPDAAHYYHEAFAGGALGNPPSVDGADYVYHHAEAGDFELPWMAWQVHFNNCGGLPGMDDVTIFENFEQKSRVIRARYDFVSTHFFLVAKLDGKLPICELAPFS